MALPPGARPIRDALRALGVERFVLAIHDVSFPSMPDEETGRGSPYTRGARAFLELACELGFDGVQLGPQGQTSPGNMSPYDGSVFSKSELSVPLAELATDRYARLLPREVVDAVVAGAAAEGGPAGRARYRFAFTAQAESLALAAHGLRARASEGDPEACRVEGEVAAFAARSPWLLHDARFEAFAAVHGTDDHRCWPALDRSPDAARIAEVEAASAGLRHAYAFAQWVLDEEHRSLRRTLEGLGLRLYGDLQVGLSLRDRWMRDGLFLPRYRMGAPPSRTNPEGQPWGYPVLDPRQFHATPSAPLAFLRLRLEKMFAEFDGVRIDHPHGLVCPWVYDASLPDPLAAVQAGARLFETPDDRAHPELADLAIVRPDQIDRAVPAYHDDRARDLDEAQVAAYAVLVDVVMAAARGAGRKTEDVLCEVLSTCPRPLYLVTQRHGLGRFRITQKANPAEPADVYRGENAGPRDWIMIGNHDTDPLLMVMDRWAAAGKTLARASYLATRLEAEPSAREAFASRAEADPRFLATAMLADLFVGPAANVLLFWADLFGEREPYNRPGVVSDDNWTMRVPGDFRRVYAARKERGEALDVAAALALAIRARGSAFAEAHRELLDALVACGA